MKTTVEDYLLNDGLGYTTLWSIGCPFHCAYCGNTKFIANDKTYKRIRHPSARYMVDQVKDARARFPHLSQVSFHDDSFMAIPYGQLEEFAELWHDELMLPFAVYGVIPNYVRQDKFELLSWAGMNRIRMGIQSGSKNMLDFYKRPTPPEKILRAGEVIASFAPKYHIPAAYDIIMDNPIETRDDVKSTLQLLYMMDRPYTLFIYSLKVIPNTGLATAMEERGVDLDEIDDSYLAIPPKWANLMLYIIALWRPPPWLWNRLMGHVRASHEEQKLYPRLGVCPAHAVSHQARAVPRARHGLLDHARQDRLLRVEGRPRRLLAEAPHAPPAAPRAHGRQQAGGQGRAARSSTRRTCSPTDAAARRFGCIARQAARLRRAGRLPSCVGQGCPSPVRPAPLPQSASHRDPHRHHRRRRARDPRRRQRRRARRGRRQRRPTSCPPARRCPGSISAASRRRRRCTAPTAASRRSSCGPSTSGSGRSATR